MQLHGVLYSRVHVLKNLLLPLSCQKDLDTNVAVLAAARKHLVAAESCAAVARTMYVQDSALRWNWSPRTTARWNWSPRMTASNILSVVSASAAAQFSLTMELLVCSVTDTLIRLMHPCKI